ncbi:DUF4192 domain-containing protein [Streptomyces fumanus]|uniref:DUF4192 domain-containing protein n=1 Tax=Streptomyces fumanus TaxID=67302 RepID=UPI0033F109BE
MTHHSETTGPSDNSDDGGIGRGQRPDSPAQTAYDGHTDEHRITLRTPAELADALPYLLGYRPEDSIVLVALHDRDGRGRFGGRARLGVPANPDDWDSAARQLVHGLVTGSERRGARPEQMVAYLCQEPSRGETGRQVMSRLRPLAQKLRVECGTLDVPVVEALCISDGRFWSYCCDDRSCCPAEGVPMGLPGTSVLAAAATYAGIQVRGTLRQLRARLLPRDDYAAEQQAALDRAGLALIPRMLGEQEGADVARETLALADRVMKRLGAAPFLVGAAESDVRDDGLLDHDEAAKLIIGLQDRTTRDRAAEWMEADEAGPALRLWRALARRCVGSYGEHAAAPLTLAGWVAWSAGDELEAREALAMAMGADPEYLFARLLHQACNEGLDPEAVRHCLRAARGDRLRSGAEETGDARGAAAPAIEPAPGAANTPASDVVPGAENPRPPVSEAAPGAENRQPPASEAAPGTRRRRTRTATPADDRHRPGVPGVRRGREPGTYIVRPHAPAGSTRPGDTPTGRTPRPRAASRGEGTRRDARPGTHGTEHPGSEE